MARSADAKPKPFRRARLPIASLIALSLGLFVAMVTGGTETGRALELRVSDGLRRAAALPDEDTSAEAVPVTTIEVDDSALRQIGHWPWPWTHLAEVVDLLVELRARLIVLDIEFAEADPPRVLQRTAPDGTRVEEIVHTVPPFVDSVRAAGNVLIPFTLYLEGRAGAETQSKGKAQDPRQNAEQRERTPVPPVLEPHDLAVSPESAAGLLEAEGFQPMIPELGGACAGAGYTSVLADPEDGVVRRVPALARCGGKVFPHLMLESAGYWRFGPDYRVRLEGGRLILSSADGTRQTAVAVDEAARLNLRWPTSLATLRRVPVTWVLMIAEKRRAFEQNRARWRHVMGELDGLFPEEGWSKVRRQLDDALGRAASAGPDSAAAKEGSALRARLARIEERLAMNLAEYAQQPAPPETETQTIQARRAAAARKYFDFVAAYHQAQEKLAQDVEASVARLRPDVEGRLCVVGLNATALAGADLHTTPLGPHTPGVATYPAGIRTILSGVAFRRLPRLQEGAIAVLLAWLVAVATARLPTLSGIASALVLSALLIGGAWLASARAAVLLPVAGPVLAVVVAFAGVSGYRQLTEAAGRRWITRVFQQYTSADHVEEILRDPERLRLGGERRDITVLFSDVAGFTSLSEQLEPERLVALLNHYLSAMTEVLLAEKATLDKYEGDAIIAFFGAPALLPDHAIRAVRGTLAMQAALPRVSEELVRMGLLPEGHRLGMRIGCSTGPAIVGNLGSERRFDYTVMGDTVNLGARLEEANRWLGSRILVPGPTQAACGEAVLFRRFGPARIRGKAETVRLYEPLAMEPAPPDLKAIAEAFNHAVDALAGRDLQAAEAALADLSAAHPEDGAARALKDRLAAAKAGQIAPDEPWDLAKPK